MDDHRRRLKKYLHKKQWMHVPLSKNSDVAMMLKYHFLDLDAVNDGARDSRNKVCDERSMVKDSDDRLKVKDDGFVILFTDVRFVYFSSSSSSEIDAKNAELNSSLTYSSHRSLLSNIEKCLLAFLSDEDGLGTRCHMDLRDPSKFSLDVSLMLGGRIPFHWSFEASRLPEDFVESELTIPLMRHRCSLLAENRRLKSLLIAKDAEIEDLKLSGAKVSRKALITDKFYEKADDGETAAEEWLKKLVATKEEEEEPREKEEDNCDGTGDNVQSGLSAIDNSDKPDSVISSKLGLQTGTKRSASVADVSSSSSTSCNTNSSLTSFSSTALLHPPTLGAKEKAAKVRKKKLGL